MELIITKNSQEMARKATRIIANLVKNKPKAVLGLATGRTMIPVYKELVKIARKEKIDFSKITTFNVDDYLGLSAKNPASHAYYMNKHFFSKANINKKNTHLPDKNIKSYGKLIKKAGGIDLQLLGIGRNGHIGYNEPGQGSTLNSKDRKIKLTENTRKANSGAFPSLSKVPKYAVTLGISTILKAREILLLANGKHKADAIAKAVKGKISSKNPASFLRKHKNCLFIVDKEAAGKI